MPLWLQILMPVVLAPFCSTIVVAIATYIVNSPKRREARREREAQAYQAELDHFKNEIQQLVASAREERSKERSACGREHSEVINRLDAIAEENKLQSHGLQTVLRNTLKLRYEKWLALGYAPSDSKRDLEDMYNAYHRLGANGVLDAMRDQFLKLPTERVYQAQKGRKKDQDDSLHI